MQRVLVFGSYPPSLINFRGAMLKAMVKAGHEVHVISPPADPDLIAVLAAMGVTHHTVPLSRTGLNPFADFSSLIAITRLLLRLRPDCQLSYSIKPVIYGGLAARLTAVPFYAMITGLGFAFNNSGLKGRVIGGITGTLYKLSLRQAHKVFFQNRDNLNVFRKHRLLSGDDQAVLISGSGVDVDYFTQQALPATPTFLLITRLLRDKGVVEYIEAARQIKARHRDVKFRLAGWIDDNPAAISRLELGGWIDEGVIEYMGRLQDVRPALVNCAVYVLPSYHEGMPRTVLEAMATGRPIITTDAPGCRETVVEGENGFLVPVQDSKALAETMQKFIDDPELVERMGKASRRLAEERFDVHKVNRVILKTMGLA